MPRQLSSEERARASEAARIIPGFAQYQDTRDAAARAQQRANSRVDPAVQAQRDAASRIARLQQMQATLTEQGNTADAEAVAAIIADLQGQAAPAQAAAAPGGPGTVMGGQVGQSIARRRNAFAGMGPR